KLQQLRKRISNTLTLTTTQKPRREIISSTYSSMRLVGRSTKRRIASIQLPGCLTRRVRASWITYSGETMVNHLPSSKQSGLRRTPRSDGDKRNYMQIVLRLSSDNGPSFSTPM